MLSRTSISAPLPLTNPTPLPNIRPTRSRVSLAVGTHLWGFFASTEWIISILPVLTAESDEWMMTVGRVEQVIPIARH